MSHLRQNRTDRFTGYVLGREIYKVFSSKEGVDGMLGFHPYLTFSTTSAAELSALVAGRTLPHENSLLLISVIG